MIAERLRSVPGHTVLNAHYTGTFALLGYHFPQRFFNRLGATEVDPDTICNKAGHDALRARVGPGSVVGTLPGAGEATAVMLRLAMVADCPSPEEPALRPTTQLVAA